jgi:RNA polymerase sigma-70 factor (ECF subfamily)
MAWPRRSPRPRPPASAADTTEAEGAHPDHEFLARLVQGDEQAFRELVGRYDAGLRRLARLYVSPAIADEVVQDTWVTVIRRVDGFQGRSALKTWVYGIMVNVARRRAQQEGRTVPFASAATAGMRGRTVDPARLQHPDLGAGYWPAAPTWARDPAAAALASETHQVVLRAVQSLAPAQREVITLRDVEGWTGPEVCEVLGISEVNQRTLLHRARTAVRAVLEEYFDG